MADLAGFARTRTYRILDDEAGALIGRQTADDLVDRYMCGECMVMATTLSKMYDVPMVGVHDDVWTTVPRHVAVDMRSGRYADARGLDLSQQELLSPYAACEVLRIKTIEHDEVRRIWGRRIQCWQVPEDHLIRLGLAQRSLAAYILEMASTSAPLRAS